MRAWQLQLLERPLLLGLLIGLLLGCLNVLHTWIWPLADDTPGALLGFYGPTFFVWAYASFREARRTGRLFSGTTTGLTVAFGTFLVFDLLIFVRVNLFLEELTGRADWQQLLMRYRASGIDSLRFFVNLDYTIGIPLKLGVSCAIGALMGGIGGLLGQLAHRRIGRILTSA